jgi:hypothetical protein
MATRVFKHDFCHTLFIFVQHNLVGKIGYNMRRPKIKGSSNEPSLFLYGLPFGGFK